MTFDEARLAAFKAGCFIVVKPNAYLLYRSAKPKGVLIGRRKEEKQMIALVKKACAPKEVVVE